ncbi:general transcription factor iih [Plasmopara halstedii]|uniref:General transcription factor iih n=1 Tax=Plasmopara halstedii TaxID=4781 RepID=A0A0P1APW3_PLAHL|nr:general transcription factor iih [Plasmopara halstedii]CEG43554.1 general transcription factor iih [Plasmopara halstedii]|eukprot:XP_024579923.1 general transcription factor iih [Plasmopara halstedii]
MSEVLVALVRVKKRDGCAEFSHKGLRWTADVSSESSVGHHPPIVVLWNNVHDQQISSRTSPKAMIRLRLAHNSTLVLEFFTHSGNLEDAFAVREQAKDYIARRLRENGASGLRSNSAALCNPTEIKQRAALLAANPALKRQHTEMVNDGLISEEDFWASRRHLIAGEASKRQKTAKTSAILTDLAANNDSGGNVVKYNLNAEVIHQIFTQYPAVYMAYQEQVPDKMTETEFWGAFFKSKYFHRDRKAGHEDMFSKYEEKGNQEAMNVGIDPRGIVDPLIDLTTTEEDAAVHHAKRRTNKNKKDDPGSITITKFNRHGAYVLDPAHGVKLQQQKAQKNNAQQSSLSPKKPSAGFHDNLGDATLLDDLRNKPSRPYNPLTLEDESRYFQHAQKGTAADIDTPDKMSLVQAALEFQATCRAPFHLELAYPSSNLCFNVLAEVVACSDSTSDSASASSAANLASGALAAEYIPNEFKKQVYIQFHDVCELLRHFLSFKTKVAEGGGPEAQHKLNRIVEKMGSKYDELVKLRESLPPHEKNLLAPLLKPFDDQLNLAFI